MASFSLTRTSNTSRSRVLVRDLDPRRILPDHAHRPARCSRSSSPQTAPSANHARRWSRARIGASERKERHASLRMISGDARREETVWGVEVGGEDATVWRMSPIWEGIFGYHVRRVRVCVLTWQVTAVHGMVPINAPRTTSGMGTPHTPQATLIPLQGTTPMSLRTLRRTHAVEVDVELLVESDDPLIAARVRSRARGKSWDRMGESGAARRAAQREPRAVRVVRRRVAREEGRRAPARTF
jgi:hypothetical protein